MATLPLYGTALDDGPVHNGMVKRSAEQYCLNSLKISRYVDLASQIDFTDATLASLLVPVQCTSLAPLAVLKSVNNSR